MRHAVQVLDRRVQAFDHAQEAFAALAPAARRARAANVRMSPPAMKCRPAPRSTTTRSAVVAGDRRRVRDQRVDHRGVERVERVRAIERQRRDGAVAGEQDGIVHGQSAGDAGTRRRMTRAGAMRHRRSSTRTGISPTLAPPVARLRNGRAASSSSTACATSTRSRAQKSAIARGELAIGDRVRRPRGRPARSPRASLCTPCAPPSKRAILRSMQNSIAW